MTRRLLIPILGIEQITHHRNGVTDLPYYTVQFSVEHDDKRRRLVAVVFEDSMAIFDRDDPSVSWKPEDFRERLEEAIKSWCADWRLSKSPVNDQ